MNPEFKRHLDEIRDYVSAVPAEARASLMEALVGRLLEEFKPSRLADRGNVFRLPAAKAAPNNEPSNA